MIVFDANVLVVDLGYPGDPNYATNRRFVEYVATNRIERAITVQALLEVVGKRSFNTPAALVAQLPAVIAIQYGLQVFPALDPDSAYAGCTHGEVVAQMARKMSLGDALMAIQVAKFVPSATAIVTWDAGHFRGKTAVPVLTPAEWLLQLPPAGPTP